MTDQLWRKNFKTKEEFEIARLKLMIDLTKRAVGSGNHESLNFLQNQIDRLNKEIESLLPKKKLTKKKKKTKMKRKPKRG